MAWAGNLNKVNAMKIGLEGGNSPLGVNSKTTTGGTSTNGKKVSADAAGGSNAGESISVNLSMLATQMQMADAGGIDAPYDAERVDAIKQAITAGQFKVNPERVADKLIANVRELMGTDT